ncbi:MAG: hypothetical protein AMXMBFR56_57010 [Polyangiaceae bacterium]
MLPATGGVTVCRVTTVWTDGAAFDAGHRARAARAVVDAAWSPTSKLVGLAVIALADRHGLVRMTQAELGRRCGLTDRTVRTALSEMAAGGRVVVGHERSCFRVLLDYEGERTGPPEPEGGSGAEAAETGNSFRKPTPSSRNVVPEVSEEGSGSPPELRASRTVSENSSWVFG